MSGYVIRSYSRSVALMDIWNNEIVSHALFSKRSDRMTYISGLESLLALKQRFPEHEMILHSVRVLSRTAPYTVIALCLILSFEPYPG